MRYRRFAWSTVAMVLIAGCASGPPDEDVAACTRAHGAFCEPLPESDIEYLSELNRAIEEAGSKHLRGVLVQIRYAARDGQSAEDAVREVRTYCGECP